MKVIFVLAAIVAVAFAPPPPQGPEGPPPSEEDLRALAICKDVDFDLMMSSINPENVDPTDDEIELLAKMETWGTDQSCVDVPSSSEETDIDSGTDSGDVDTAERQLYNVLKRILEGEEQEEDAEEQGKKGKKKPKGPRPGPGSDDQGEDQGEDTEGSGRRTKGPRPMRTTTPFPDLFTTEDTPAADVEDLDEIDEIAELTDLVRALVAKRQGGGKKGGEGKGQGKKSGDSEGKSASKDGDMGSMNNGDLDIDDIGLDIEDIDGMDGMEGMEGPPPTPEEGSGPPMNGATEEGSGPPMDGATEEGSGPPMDGATEEGSGPPMLSKRRMMMALKKALAHARRGYYAN